MKRLRRPFIALIVVVALLAGISALAWALVDSERIRSEMSAALGRDVRFDSISPGLFSINVDGLTIGDTASFDPRPLLTCRSISLRYSLFSLLTGRLLVNKITLEAPVIGIELDSGGLTNVTDLLTPREGGPLFDLQVLEIRDGRVSLAAPGQSIELDALNLEISNLNGAPWLIRSDLKLLAAPVTLAGTVDPATLVSRLKITTQGLPLDSAPIPASVMNPAGLTLDLDAEIGYAVDSGSFEGKGKIPGLATIEGKIVIEWLEALMGRGQVSITASAAGLRRIVPLKAKLDELQADGDLRVAVRVDGPLDAIPTSVDGELLGFGVKPPGFTSRLANMRGAFSLSPSRLTLKEMNLEAAGSPLAVSGEIGLPEIKLDLALSSPRVDLKALSGLIEPSPFPPGLALAGPAKIDLKLKGTPPNVAATGTVELLGATLNLADPKTELSAINGTLSLAGDEIRLVGLTCRLGGSTLATAGTINRAKETLDVTLKAERLTLADLPVALGSDRLKLDGTASFDGKISGRMASPSVVGQLAADRATLFAVPVTDISGNLRYDGEKLQLEEVRATALDGGIAGDATVTLAGDRLPFSINLDLGGLSLARTIQTICGSNALTGGVTKGRLALSGDGKNVGSYNGSGAFTAEGIVIPALPLMKSIGTVLGLSTGSLENFTGGSLSFTISGGKLMLSRPMILTNQNLELRFSGGLGLDGSIDGLSLMAGVRDGILPTSIGGIPLAGVFDLKKENGRTYIPVRCRGSLMAPTLTPDINAANVVTNLVGERLGIDLGALPGNRPVSSSQEAPAADAKKDTAADASQATPASSEPVRPDPVGIITDIFNRRRR